MWRAVRASDAGYDGIFCFAVRSTGVFCRPSCTARKPRRENVRYFADAASAAAAGFRACKRCRPERTPGAPPEWIGRLLERLTAQPPRAENLRDAGITPARARRWFRRYYGMSFHELHEGYRMSKALDALRDGRRIDDTAEEAGFASLSGFRDAFRRVFAQPPGAAEDVDCVRLRWIETPLGPMVAGASDAGVCLLIFVGDSDIEAELRGLRDGLGCAVLPGKHPLLDRLETELAAYFAGRLRQFSLPLHQPGTAFQQAVWAALQAIPFGETRSYRDIATAVGRPAATRAVGTANGRNRIAVVIPCHRVINAGGALGGYGGGLERKRWLLRHEAETASAAASAPAPSTAAAAP
jgi:AraC family transcriptional regulator of adaptative response/methylated-DNA-[protein]-cysteine methyltransferase